MKRIIFTQGDPTGVGPELLLHAASMEKLRSGDVVVAGRERLAALAKSMKTDWANRGWQKLQMYLTGPGGKPHDRLGQFDALQYAVDLILKDTSQGLVTAPIDKACAVAEGLKFPGHTDYLAARSKVDNVTMLLVGPRLRVGLATVHIPISSVATELNTSVIVERAKLLTCALREHFACEKPRIGILGLNPHAGENGILGNEESKIIDPAIAKLREWAGPGADFFGPMPADTAFFIHAEGRLDGVLAMYHDQGLGPFKLLHFHDGVNMTLGLPFIRTSPDHGTARDIAGTGKVDPRSFMAAIDLARGGSS